MWSQIGPRALSSVLFPKRNAVIGPSSSPENRLPRSLSQAERLLAHPGQVEEFERAAAFPERGQRVVREAAVAENVVQ